MKTLLSIKNLSIQFRNRQDEYTTIVKGVNLNLRKGEILGIVGESGSGKSVTALSVLGLLPYPKARTGQDTSIIFNNVELTKLSNSELQKIRGNEISFIFQEPMSSLNPLHKIGKQIAESIRLHQNISNEKINKKVIELLKLVKIPNPEEKINSFPFELSGGQRQRVMIAMAIANNPKILIADEPTTALDVTIQEQIIDLLLELKEKLDMSIIFISHNLRLVHKISDNIAVMYQGKIVEYGEADSIFNSPKNDYTKKLITSNNLLKNSAIINGDIVLACNNIVVKFVHKKNFWGKIISEQTAVNNVSLQIKKGETLGIVGESGSGKTTLALSLVNLVKHSGNVLIENDGKLTEKTSNCKDLQIVFQDPYNSLNPRMTVKEIIGEGLSVYMKHISADDKEKYLMNIMQEVELSKDDLNKYPHEFSGGQRQRIALARSLIIKPKIVILDEPTSALDVTVQAQIIDLLKKLQKQYNLSYIFISHDMNAIRAISHRVIVMKDGFVVEEGSTDKIFNSPNKAYTKRLIRASI